MKDSSSVSWIPDNKTTNWSSGVGSHFRAMGHKYNLLDKAIKMTPYEMRPRSSRKKEYIGSSTDIPREFLKKVTSGIYEEEVRDLLSSSHSELAKRSEIVYLCIRSTAGLNATT